MKSIINIIKTKALRIESYIIERKKKRCISKLIRKAIYEIPRMPIRTRSVDHIYVTVRYIKYRYYFCLKCTPASSSDGPNEYRMFVCCHLLALHQGITIDEALFFETIPIIMEKLKDDSIHDIILENFESALRASKDY